MAHSALMSNLLEILGLGYSHKSSSSKTQLIAALLMISMLSLISSGEPLVPNLNRGLLPILSQKLVSRPGKRYVITSSELCEMVF